MIAELRVEAHQLNLLGQRRAGQSQHIVELIRQGEERRADVEREAVTLTHSKLSAHHIVAFEHVHPMADRSQSDCGAKATDASADDGDVSHG